MAGLKYKPSSPMPRIGFKVNPNQIFFDRRPVIDAVGRATAKAMGESAREIRKKARRSMPYTTERAEQIKQMAGGKRKRFSAVKVSRPDQPPRAIRPHPFVKKFLWYKFDLRTRSAVIGPEWSAVAGATGAPRILEHGGITKREKNKRRKRRVMGGSGELRIGGPRTRTTRQGVTYGRLTTPRQVARANRLNEELYGPEYIGGKFQKARPFMGPALVKEVPNMARRWQATVHN